MEKIPLQNRLKREVHRKIAHAQDIIILEVYKVIDSATLHGGTAIWRCLNGKRFSEDLDFYFPKDLKKINTLFDNLENVGFEIVKKKILENSVYSELILDRTSVRLEATFQKAKGSLMDYEMLDGNFISIYSLTPEQFISEKVITYLKRLKIRDLWDVFFLLKGTNEARSIKEIETLIKNYKNPLDEEDLKTIILEGIVPSSGEMIDYIKRKWENKYI